MILLFSANTVQIRHEAKPSHVSDFSDIYECTLHELNIIKMNTRLVNEVDAL